MNQARALLAETIARIPTTDADTVRAARARLDTLTKPQGSLGRLEDLAADLLGMRPAFKHEPLRKAVFVFAADHGLAAEGVSAYPAEVTTQMVLNFLAGGAAINVLARLHGGAIHIVDAGVMGDLPAHPQLTSAKIRRGSRNMLHEAALSTDELHAALELGIRVADRAAALGYNCIAVGEMGIGNTSAASLLTATLTQSPLAECTGRGTGLSDAAYAAKLATLAAVLDRHQADSTDALALLRSFGGLEIAAMTAFYLRCAIHRISLVCDGFISTAAAAIAVAIAPTLQPFLVAGHQSQEPGHRILLTYLKLQPLLQLHLRLGEGTGAVLAMPILESALHLYREMATFSSANVATAGAQT